MGGRQVTRDSIISIQFNIQRGDLRFNQLKIEDGQGQGDVNSYSGWAPVDVNAGQIY